jgi:hypothetical protein
MRVADETTVFGSRIEDLAGRAKNRRTVICLSTGPRAPLGDAARADPSDACRPASIDVNVGNEGEECVGLSNGCLSDSIDLGAWKHLSSRPWKCQVGARTPSLFRPLLIGRLGHAFVTGCCTLEKKLCYLVD